MSFAIITGFFVRDKCMKPHHCLLPFYVCLPVCVRILTGGGWGVIVQSRRPLYGGWCNNGGAHFLIKKDLRVE